jgi:hypothetical protein
VLSLEEIKPAQAGGAAGAGSAPGQEESQ